MMSLPGIISNNAQDGYLLRVSDPQPEWSQLDEQHAAWNEWMGGIISFAPIQEPRTILELGSGSGAWAIEVASIYPNAAVTAVDIAGLPPRQLPPNVGYVQHDLNQAFPFDNDSFDVVHARLVLSHLPRPHQILNRMVRLTRPGGWFLVEDVCFNHEPSNGKGEMSTVIADFRAFTEGVRKQDNAIGKKLKEYIRQSDLFDIVEEKVFVITRGKPVEDPVDQRFGAYNLRRYRHAMETVHRNISAAGKTTVHKIDFENLWDETDDSAFASLHFVWAHRKTQTSASELALSS